MTLVGKCCYLYRDASSTTHWITNHISCLDLTQPGIKGHLFNIENKHYYNCIYTIIGHYWSFLYFSFNTSSALKDTCQSCHTLLITKYPFIRNRWHKSSIDKTLNKTITNTFSFKYKCNLARSTCQSCYTCLISKWLYPWELTTQVSAWKYLIHLQSEICFLLNTGNTWYTTFKEVPGKVVLPSL